LSEWYDSQKNPSGDFRKLLQECLDKTNPRRTKVFKEVKRLCKEFGFTARMLKGSIAEGRKKK